MRVRSGIAASVMAGACLAASCGTSSSHTPDPPDLHRIKHVVVIMQENRSFDSYFGTFPGANGIPMTDGQPTVCAPNPMTGGCDPPHHDPNDRNAGGPHDHPDAVGDINGGQMDGFVAQAQRGYKGCPRVATEGCDNRATPDVMGWHDAREIPNYWSYAKDYVLQDNMFGPIQAGSSPAHLYLVSAWSAKCARPGDPLSCRSAPNSPSAPPDAPGTTAGSSRPDPNYAWTDLTWLLHQHKVSWGYYVATGEEPDCRSGESQCLPHFQNAKTAGIWNPLPYFTTVQQDGELNNIQPSEAFVSAATSGTLPAVSWVAPDGNHSEHPPAKLSDGQAYVTTLINSVMQGPDWSSTAIFLAWDDWGGFYDHVNPPTIDQAGYGIRVPGLVISPYAKTGYIDHQTLSVDAYTKFIEDDFLGGARLDPATDGRPDPRPNVRENAAQLGDLTNDFDFNQTPRPPKVLDPQAGPGRPSQ